jgi:tripartite-type tricarboxylate transporter receptor subunit TctC
MYAPSNVPPRVIERLNEAVTASLAHPDVRAKLAALGMTPLSASPREVRGMLEHDRQAYGARARQLREAAQVK